MSDKLFELVQKHMNIIFPLNGKYITFDGNVYKADTVNKSTGNEVTYKIYNCGEYKAEFNTKIFENLFVEDEHEDYQVIIVYEDMEHMKTVKDEIKKEKKKENIDFFKKAIALYFASSEEISLTIEETGVNYLHYMPNIEKNREKAIEANIFNISFLELEKLYNVTGSKLFDYNVRYGLEKPGLKKQFSAIFFPYLKKSLYRNLENTNITNEDLSKIRAILDLEDDYCYDEDISKPDNFWFFHNGITIFSFTETNKFSNKITLNPQEVSVINGAQTITNFFLLYDDLKEVVFPLIEEIIGCEIDKDAIIQRISVKTILIEGHKDFIDSITQGLNIQIPITKETIVATDETVQSLNTELNNKVKIIKEGEMEFRGYCYTPLAFCKIWLIHMQKPGSSKNFNKNKMEKQLEEILSSLKDEDEMIADFVRDIGKIRKVEEWWKIARRFELLDATRKDEEKEVIRLYGSVYFQSFVLKYTNKGELEINEPLLMNLFQRFLETFSISRIVNPNEFKKDNLYNEVMKGENNFSEVSSLTSEEVDGILDTLNITGQSQYSFFNAISRYLISINKNIDYFRVISMIEGTPLESFPFPNSTFSELCGDKYKTATYQNSSLKAQVNKKYPLFVISKQKKSSNDNNDKVLNVEYIPEFTFSKYDKDAEKAYNKTIDAFKEQNQYKFPKSSEKLVFHVRTKAIDGNDTFMFTNGEEITKRTFWANKDNIKVLVEDFQKQ